MPQIKTKVEKYNNDLKGVVSYNNKDYALDNLIVGEEVELEISKDQSRVSLKKVLTESPNRIKPECGIYNKCGGCSLLHIKYQEQLKIKTTFVENLFFDVLNGELEKAKIEEQYDINNMLPILRQAYPEQYKNANERFFVKEKVKINTKQSL